MTCLVLLLTMIIIVSVLLLIKLVLLLVNRDGFGWVGQYGENKSLESDMSLSVSFTTFLCDLNQVTHSEPQFPHI